jgi:RNA polymerase sigma-70 factor (ECF subfamily)
MSDPAVMHGALRHLRRTERRRLYRLLGDRELLARFLADRDEAAFEEVVARHGPMVRAVCRRVLGPSIDADDAFQAAFLVLLRRARSIRRADLLAGWLCAVAYRTARQALRRRSRRRARERLVDELPEPARPDDPPKDWLPLFDDALQRLPAKYRDPVVLCELQGLSRRDASARLGLSEGTLSSRLGRARDLLRRKLDRYGFPLALGSAVAPAVVPEALTASTSAAAAHVSAASVSAVVLSEGVLTAMLASKLKAGALAGSAVVFLGVVAGLQLTGPVSGAGGPPDKDGVPAREAAKEAQPPAAKPDPKPVRLAPEYEPFQGRWEVTAAERDGSAQSVHGVGIDENWTFTGNTLTTGGEAKADASEAFTLDPRAKPPTIDFTLTQFTADGTGALSRTPCQGIYRFEADGRLVICCRRKDNGILRPARFATAHNSGATLVSLRRPEPKAAPTGDVEVVQSDDPFPTKFTRAKAAPADPAKDAELGKVVGAWELVDVDSFSPDAAAARLDAKGHPMGGERSRQRWEGLRRLQLLPATGPMDLGNQPGAASFVAYVELDGSRSPKWFTMYASETRRPAEKDLDIRVTRDLRLCGIYKLDGDKLVVCLPEAEGSPLLRPTDFKGDGEGGLYLLTYQRAAKNWKPEARPAPTPPTVSTPAVTPDLPAVPAFPPAAVDGSISPVGLPPVGPIAPPVVPAVGVPTSGPLPPPTAGPGPMAVPPPGVPEDRAPSVSLPQAADYAPPRAEPPASDLDRLQGVWVMSRTDGKAPTGELDTLEILKDRVLASDGTHGRVRVDETKSPRQITITLGKQPTDLISGIYKLEGDRLTIASSTKSPKLIPTGFDADPDAGIRVDVFERPKTPAPSSSPRDAPKADPAPKPPARDLQNEIDQLREHLKRLEKELKDRKD